MSKETKEYEIKRYNQLELSRFSCQCCGKSPQEHGIILHYCTDEHIRCGMCFDGWNGLNESRNKSKPILRPKRKETF
jgi:hypothetical protein